ncbi:MAG TPA: glutathione peroxidase [Caulobacteraceae bacterium]|jgi:glutathione peroxidase
MTSVYDFSAKTLAGQDKPLADFRGQALLIVNVASRCGFTPQYEGLEELQGAYEGRGLAVLGFPCDQFGHQEPGDEAEIERFCSLTYGVSFPMFAKIEVNGVHAHPLYRFLAKAKRGVLGSASIKWNFTKFLVGRDGTPIARYAPSVEPAAIAPDIEKALG